MVVNDNLKAQEEVLGKVVSLDKSNEASVTEKPIDPTVKHALEEAPVELSAEDSKRVLRKLDICLMPMMCLVVLFQFLDKTSLNYANLL